MVYFEARLDCQITGVGQNGKIHIESCQQCYICQNSTKSHKYQINLHHMFSLSYIMGCQTESTLITLCYTTVQQKPTQLRNQLNFTQHQPREELEIP